MHTLIYYEAQNPLRKLILNTQVLKHFEAQSSDREMAKWIPAYMWTGAGVLV